MIETDGNDLVICARLEIHLLHHACEFRQERSADPRTPIIDKCDNRRFLEYGPERRQIPLLIVEFHIEGNSVPEFLNNPDFGWSRDLGSHKRRSESKSGNHEDRCVLHIAAFKRLHHHGPGSWI
jgi:hypothetical protein